MLGLVVWSTVLVLVVGLMLLNYWRQRQHPLIGAASPAGRMLAAIIRRVASTWVAVVMLVALTAVVTVGLRLTPNITDYQHNVFVSP